MIYCLQPGKGKIQDPLDLVYFLVVAPVSGRPEHGSTSQTPSQSLILLNLSTSSLSSTTRLNRSPTLSHLTQLLSLLLSNDSASLWLPLKPETWTAACFFLCWDILSGDCRGHESPLSGYHTQAFPEKAFDHHLSSGASRGTEPFLPVLLCKPLRPTLFAHLVRSTPWSHLNMPKLWLLLSPLTVPSDFLNSTQR